MMKHILWMLVLATVFAHGCKTVDVESPSKTAVVGSPVQSIMKAHDGHRIRIFDTKGKELKQLPVKQEGSVSIYNKEITGQDNYVFNSNGVVTEHRRSYGEDYSQGVWKKVE